MLYKIIAMMILIGFYFFYIARIVIQTKQSIKTNQMGKGNKSRKVLLIERIMSVATIMVIVVEICSVFLVEPLFPVAVIVVGIIIGFLAVIIFGLATTTMNKSWRVGIPEEKTTIVTHGIYSISRNPAFLAFDMLYLSIVLIFFNVPLLICSAWAVIMLHLQILQEEQWLSQTFSDEYRQYSSKVGRYL